MLTAFRLQRLLYHRIVPLLVALLIVKVTLNIVSNYVRYFPADFESDFLSGRESYFSGFYQWPFYVHIVASPWTLILGLVLVSEAFRKRWPVWHRRLGRIQAALVLCLVVPSGLAMAFYAEGGLIAASGFIALALTTAVCVAFGWRTAMTRRFVQHRRWMARTFVLLCSAVVLRLMAGLATVVQLEATWTYPATAWASWCGPLIVLEVLNRRDSGRGKRRKEVAGDVPRLTSGSW